MMTSLCARLDRLNQPLHFFLTRFDAATLDALDDPPEGAPTPSRARTISPPATSAGVSKWAREKSRFGCGPAGRFPPGQFPFRGRPAADILGAGRFQWYAGGRRPSPAWAASPTNFSSGLRRRRRSGALLDMAGVRRWGDKPHASPGGPPGKKFLFHS